jgi:hypothetical protein
LIQNEACRFTALQTTAINYELKPFSPLASILAITYLKDLTEGRAVGGCALKGDVYPTVNASFWQPDPRRDDRMSDNMSRKLRNALSMNTMKSTTSDEN